MASDDLNANTESVTQMITAAVRWRLSFAPGCYEHLGATGLSDSPISPTLIERPRPFRYPRADAAAVGSEASVPG
jgi:hypothetical protein